jgi:DNA polymerase III alpha subunit (gram-positive type)
MTVEDLGARTGVSKTVIEILEASGALKDIPRTAQLSFF